jgi:integrase
MGVGRKPECRFYESKKQFATTIRGRRYLLGADEKKARERFAFLMEQDGRIETVKDANPLLGDLFCAWIRYLKPYRHPDRLRLCKQRLAEFLDRMGHGARIGDLRVAHVEAWIKDKHARGKNGKGKRVTPGTERAYKAILLACLNWCARPESKDGGELIPCNPLKGRLRLPEGGSRGEDAVWTPESFDQVCRLANPRFVDAVRFLAATGCRPSLMCRLEARHYNRKFRRFDTDAITSRRKKLKYLMLTPKAIALVERLVAENPTGKLFRNASGGEWRGEALQIYLYNLMHKYEKTKSKMDGGKLDWQPGLSVKGLRHTFATTFLRDHPDKIEYLRVLLGHADYKMVFKHYGKLVGEHEAIGNLLMEFSTFGDDESVLDSVPTSEEQQETQENMAS